MLSIASISRSAEKKKYLDLFLQNDSSTWIVSDLRNKFEVQQLILEQQGFFEDFSVLRVSELWRHLLKRQNPDCKIVSRDFVKTWVREKIADRTPSLGAQADQVILEMMDMMAPVYSHPLGSARLREWLQDNPESLRRWGGWFMLAEELFQELHEKNMVTPQWMAGLLQNQSESSSEDQKFWQRPLIFDVGSQLKQVEADLIRSLSRHCDVLVLSPEPEFSVEFQYLLRPYEYLKAEAQHPGPKAQAEITSLPSPSTTARFSGVLGEVKRACELVRQWIELGVPAKEIAVVSSDIEKYWPLIQPLFQTEGIPVAKDIMARLQTLPAISSWLSDLRLRLKEVRYSDLETVAFQETTPDLRFEKFRALFQEMISSDDLRRHQSIERMYLQNEISAGPLSLDEFIGWALRSWRDDRQFVYLEICLRELMANAHPELRMESRSWAHYLEQIVAKKEIKVSKALPDGVQILNLTSADSLQFTRRIFLGLSEAMLRNPPESLLSTQEVLSIASQLGFYLNHPEISHLEFDLAWLSLSPALETHYYFPQTDFSGGVESPCSFWMKKTEDHELPLTMPSDSRWDSWMNSGLTEDLQTRLDQDLGNQSVSNLQLQQVPALSPSSLESYRDCPFIFTSQKLFRLMDVPTLDLDVDRRTRGQLIHWALDKVCAEPRRFDWSETEVHQILDQAREQVGLTALDDFIWQGLRRKQTSMVLRFLAFEKEWQSRFPETKVLAREKNFSRAHKMTDGSEVLIRGKIDRIDQDHDGRYVVMDYKMAPGDFKNFNSWIKDNQLQLALYMLAVQSGSVEDVPAGEVIGAFYYSLKNLARDRGLKVEEAAGTLFDLDRKKNRLSSEAKEELLGEIEDLIEETIQQLGSGKIQPEPRQLELCNDCQWRNLCRAPHLN
ncbi:MAG: hypothetical protein COT73_11575 [Bdellovibrio sp. CG10_big_fil_rev_8_21_14_0_10_47_8]|nr:MAG: hypothetical protein COT73_11575 [Bdellovibrio sp. CG10_big_fil_rev_8_21_14_0_10_47_8]